MKITVVGSGRMGKILAAAMSGGNEVALYDADRGNALRVAEPLRLRVLSRLTEAVADAVVLAVVSKEKEGTYGYKITQDVRGVLDVSESTLYPVLRRLQKDDCLEVYDMAYAGRNRRYYKLTDRGAAQLEFYKAEWKIYASKISGMFEGGIG